MTRSAFLRIQICAALALALLFGAPHVIHALRHPGAEGIIMMRSTDDGQYHAKVRAALLQRWSEVQNGMIGGNPPPRGAAPALLEFAAGGLLSWTTLKAPHVLVLLNIIITPFIVFLLAGLLRAIGLSQRTALLGTFLYVLVFLSPLQKPIHMSLSLPFTALVLLALAHALRAPRWRNILFAGTLLGLSVGTYFWAWTYLWAIAGWLVILQVLAVPSRGRWQRARAPLCIMGFALLIAAPLLLNIFHTASLGSIFQETSARSTIIHSRGVESLPRSILLTLLMATTICLTLPLRRDAEDRTWLFPLAAILAAFTVMHQNLLHGVIFTFSSHYYPFVVLSALLAGLWGLERARGVVLRSFVIGAAAIFLLTGLWDYRSAWEIAAANYYVRSLDHLAPALHLLDDGKREVILTDRTTAHAVTGWTDDDVVFTAYVRHVLISDREYAERYCLTETPDPSGPDFLWLAREVVEGWEETRVAERRAEFMTFCAPILRDPSSALRTYGVTAALWNEALRPTWNPARLGLEQAASGSGWSLWRFPPS